MKIEKLNDRQIRCTLTSADLQNHRIKLSELAFGSEKTRNLFQDMMEQANMEFGFDVENIPLMIEAIPASPDSIVLIITKIDTTEVSNNVYAARLARQNAREYTELHGLEEYNEQMKLSPTGAIRIFNFPSLDEVIAAAHAVKGIYTASNTLYKDTETQDYLLVLTRGELDGEAFIKVCNLLSEYGVANITTGATLAFLEEHCRQLVSGHALQTLENFA